MRHRGSGSLRRHSDCRLDQIAVVVDLDNLRSLEEKVDQELLCRVPALFLQMLHLAARRLWQVQTPWIVSNRVILSITIEADRDTERVFPGCA